MLTIIYANYFAHCSKSYSSNSKVKKSSRKYDQTNFNEKKRKKCPLFNGIFWQLLVCVKRISVKNPALRNYLSGIPIIYSPWVGGSNYQWGVGKIFIPCCCSRIEGGLKLISNFVPHHVIFVIPAPPPQNNLFLQCEQNSMQIF